MTAHQGSYPTPAGRARSRCGWLRGGGDVVDPCAVLLPLLLRGLTEKINKKNKHANVKPFMVKNHLWVFVNSLIENPAFDSQVGLQQVPGLLISCWSVAFAHPSSLRCPP